ncbi:MAG TPA: DedA family protein, partial [Sporolactobacillaceae bacterium]|nr:DedA family protein [Sporolactobacillaceae bacterium]
MMHSLSSGLIQFISSLGFWGIFIGMIIESACIPLPS